MEGKTLILAAFRHKIFDADFGVFVNVVGYIGKAFIDCPLFLFVQLRTGFGQTGGLSNDLIVADQSC